MELCVCTQQKKLYICVTWLAVYEPKGMVQLTKYFAFNVRNTHLSHMNVFIEEFHAYFMHYCHNLFPPPPNWILYWNIYIYIYININIVCNFKFRKQVKLKILKTERRKSAEEKTHKIMTHKLQKKNNKFKYEDKYIYI